MADEYAGYLAHPSSAEKEVHTEKRPRQVSSFKASTEPEAHNLVLVEHTIHIYNAHHHGIHEHVDAESE